MTALRASLLLAILCFSSFAPAAAHAQAVRPGDGLSYSLRVDYRETDARGRTRASHTLLARVRATGDNARYDVLRGDEQFRTGDVVITTDGGRSFHVLSARSRTVREVGMEAEERDLIDRRRIRVSFANHRMRAAPPRPCGRVGALATSCVEVTQTYDLRLRYLLLHMDGSVRERFQVWLADELAGVPNPYAAFVVGLSTVGMRDQPAMARAVRGVADRFAAGMPVRLVVTREEGPSERGAEKTKTTTMEVSDVRPAAVPASLFELPAGFRRTTR